MSDSKIYLDKAPVKTADNSQKSKREKNARYFGFYSVKIIYMQFFTKNGANVRLAPDFEFFTDLSPGWSVILLQCHCA